MNLENAIAIPQIKVVEFVLTKSEVVAVQSAIAFRDGWVFNPNEFLSANSFVNSFKSFHEAISFQLGSLARDLFNAIRNSMAKDPAPAPEIGHSTTNGKSGSVTAGDITFTNSSGDIIGTQTGLGTETTFIAPDVANDVGVCCSIDGGNGGVGDDGGDVGFNAIDGNLDEPHQWDDFRHAGDLGGGFYGGFGGGDVGFGEGAGGGGDGGFGGGGGGGGQSEPVVVME